MLAENLQHWAEKERMTGEQIGIEKGLKKGRDEARQEVLAVREEARQELRQKQQEIALNLISLGTLSNEQIADVTELGLDDVKVLIKNGNG